MRNMKVSVKVPAPSPLITRSTVSQSCSPSSPVLLLPGDSHDLVCVCICFHESKPIPVVQCVPEFWERISWEQTEPAGLLSSLPSPSDHAYEGNRPFFQWKLLFYFKLCLFLRKLWEIVSFGKGGMNCGSALLDQSVCLGCSTEFFASNHLFPTGCIPVKILK